MILLERWWYVLRLRLRSVLRRGKMDRELDDELTYHIDRAIDDYRTKGLTAKDARTAALRRFGGVTQRREYCRDERRLLRQPLGAFPSDLVSSTRQTVEVLRTRQNTTVFLTQISRLIDRGPVANGGSVVRGEWDREEAR